MRAIRVALFGSTTLVLGLAVGLPSAGATVISFTAAAGSSDGPLAASAAFTTGAGVLDVTLANLLGAHDIRSSGQALSDISFTLSTAPGTPGTMTASGQLGHVSRSGVVTYTSGSPVRFLGEGPSAPNGTGIFTINGNTILMEAIGGGTPSEMIAPAIADGGTYANANNGFGNFSPYTIGPASFVLNLSGVTQDTTVTAVTFSFGTGPDHLVRSTPRIPIPEPASMVLLVSGLLSLGLISCQRHNG